MVKKNNRSFFTNLHKKPVYHKQLIAIFEQQNDNFSYLWILERRLSD